MSTSIITVKYLIVYLAKNVKRRTTISYIHFGLKYKLYVFVFVVLVYMVFHCFFYKDLKSVFLNRNKYVWFKLLKHYLFELTYFDYTIVSSTNTYGKLLRTGGIVSIRALSRPRRSNSRRPRVCVSVSVCVCVCASHLHLAARHWPISLSHIHDASNLLPLYY